jgi:tetratricopeptide (TPR) repeat protein
MKKLFTLLALVITLGAGAQKMQVQNMANYIRNKEYEKAKASADAAIQHESTVNQAKTWLYRGFVYKAIFDTSARDMLDKEAEEKALEAFVRAMELDKGKDIYKDTAKGPLVKSAAATRDKAEFYKQNREYDKALRCYDAMERSIPFDYTGGIKRSNITKEKIMYQKFEMYKVAGDKAKTVKYADELIGIGYKEPKLFTDMVKISLADKDTASALSYIEKGRKLFEDNMELISTEIDIYLARKKTDVLKQKVATAIELTPDNEVLHMVMANIHQKTGNVEEAEKEYLKAVEIKNDYEPAIYNLAVIYYTQGKEWNDKLNKLSANDSKTKEYDSKRKEAFSKAMTYFERSYEIAKDEGTKKLLRKLAATLEDKEKYEKYK